MVSKVLQETSFVCHRAQNNGRSPDNDRPKMPLDWSLFYLTGHFDRPHLYAFRWNFKSTSEEEEGGEQSDDEEAMQEGSDCVVQTQAR